MSANAFTACCCLLCALQLCSPSFTYQYFHMCKDLNNSEHLVKGLSTELTAQRGHDLSRVHVTFNVPVTGGTRYTPIMRKIHLVWQLCPPRVVLGRKICTRSASPFPQPITWTEAVTLATREVGQQTSVLLRGCKRTEIIEIDGWTHGFSLKREEELCYWLLLLDVSLPLVRLAELHLHVCCGYSEEPSSLNVIAIHVDWNWFPVQKVHSHVHRKMKERTDIWVKMDQVKVTARLGRPESGTEKHHSALTYGHIKPTRTGRGETADCHDTRVWVQPW